MPITLIDTLKQSNRSANVGTSSFFHMLESIDINFRVTGIQTDATDPHTGSAAATGERWVVTDYSERSTSYFDNLTCADGDIVERTGTNTWVILVDVSNALPADPLNDTDEGILVYAKDKNLFYFYNGTSWGALSGTGTVTSVAITGTDGIDVDSGSAITSSGTITLGLSSIANSALTYSSVNFGGVTVALGASDTTPAFDLQHATNYPTGSLVGTISNAQLDGSIVNAKLSNSTVTIGSTSVALGATQTHFAGLQTLQILGTGLAQTSIAGISVDAAFVQKKSGGTTGLAIEPTGRITSDSGLRCYGASSVLGPKGGGTVNFIANEAVKTLLNGAISADSAVVTVDSTDGMEVNDAIIFSSDGSNNTSSTYQNHGRTIASVDSTTQITLNSNAYTGSTPLWARDNSWVDVLGTGNMTFRNSNLNDDPSGVKRSLQFDYAGDSLGRNGGELKFRTYRRRLPTGLNTNDDRLTIDADGKLEFNPTGAATADFVIEGDTDTHLFNADASADRVGISIASPKFTLDVGGSIGGRCSGPKTGNYTLSATDNIVFVTLHSSGTKDVTTPATHDEGRMIYIICDTSTGSGVHQIVANTGHTLLYDDTVGDLGFQLQKVGQMITLIGTRTADTWLCVKSYTEPHSH